MRKLVAYSSCFLVLAAVSPLLAAPPSPAAAPAADAATVLTLDDVRALIQRDLDLRAACKLEEAKTYYTPEGKERLNRYVRHLQALQLPKSPRFAGNDGVGDLTTRATFFAYRQYVTDTARALSALAQTYAAVGVENMSALRRAKQFYEGGEMTALVDQLKRFDKTYVTAKGYGPDIRARRKVAGEKLWRTDDITFRDIWIGSGMSDYMNEHLYLVPGAFTSRLTVLDRWNERLSPTRLKAMRESAEHAEKNLKNLEKILTKAAEKVEQAHLPDFAGKELANLVEFDLCIAHYELRAHNRAIVELVDGLEKAGTVASDLRTAKHPATAMAENRMGAGEIPGYRQTIRTSCFKIESAMRHAYEDTYRRPLPMR